MNEPADFARPLQGNVPDLSNGARLLAAVFDCLSTASRLSTSQLLSIDGNQVLDALEHLSSAHRTGAIREVETSARDLSVAMGVYPEMVSSAADLVPFLGAIRHIRERLSELDAAALAVLCPGSTSES